MDRSNPNFYDIAVLEEVKSELNKDFSICLFPQVNHELVDIETGQIDPEIFVKIIDWGNEQLGR